MNTVAVRSTAAYFHVGHGSRCSPKATWWEPTPFFGHHLNSWFFSNRCPGWHFRTILLVQNLQHPGSQHVSLSLHMNFPPMCQIPLFINRQSTLFLLVYTYMLRKSSSLILLWGFLPSCSERRLRRFSLFFPRKDLFEAGTLHAEIKKTKYSAMLSVIVNFEGTQPFYANNFTWWQPTPVFFYQVNFTFFFNNCPGERFETFSWN